MKNSAFADIKIVKTAYGLKYERKATMDTNSRSRFASCYRNTSSTSSLGRMRSTVFGVSVA